ERVSGGDLQPSSFSGRCRKGGRPVGKRGTGGRSSHHPSTGFGRRPRTLRTADVLLRAVAHPRPHVRVFVRDPWRSHARDLYGEGRGGTGGLRHTAHVWRAR